MLTAGPRNRKGNDGAIGKDGSSGIDGVRGSIWTSNEGKPISNDALENDQYLDTTTGDVYQLISNKWTPTGNIKGPKGPKGAKGDNGRTGIIEQIVGSVSSGEAEKAPRLIKTFNTDVFTVANNFVRVINDNTVEKISDNYSTTIPNGIFGVGYFKPTSTSIEVIFMGIVSGYSGFTIGQPLFVSTSGLPTHTVPTTGMVQQVGFAISSTELFLQLMQPMRRS